ncbi:MAG: Fur family transcriptional regulator [Nitrospirota bacterium]
MEKKIFSTFLKDKGQKLTKERAAILQNVLSYRGHFDPETLYLKVKKTGMKASRASVYRTLNLLCECGIIEKVKKTEHGTIYESVHGNEHHDHMSCIGCGHVIEFYSKDLERLQEEICKKQEFQGTSHNLEIRGFCKNCKKKRLK